MKRMILTLFLLASCSLPSTVGEDYIDRTIPMTFYTKPSEYLSGYDEVVIISTPVESIGRVHVPRDARLRYRQIYVGTVRMRAGRVWIDEYRKGIITYTNQHHRIQTVTIDRFAYPSIVLSGVEYHMEIFLTDHRSSPPYNVGDTVQVVTSFFDLEAVL